MKVLSLFDGISAARQALKELNIDCEYYASEIDKFAIQVAKANHPDIIHIGDVKNLFKYHHFNDGRYSQFYNMKRGDINLLIGGSPCQDLSIAKKDRKGLDGDRSSLFYEYLRILNEVKPKYFILENVASMSKESKDIITKELFNVEPIMINSALLTAQNRKRLYWVGKLVDGEYKQVKIKQPKDKEVYLKDIIEENVDEKYYISEKALKTYTHNGKIKNLKESNEKSVCLSANGGGRGGRTGLYAVAQRGRSIVDGKRKDIKGAKTEQRLETSYSEKANTLTTVQKDSMLLAATQIGNSKNWGNAVNNTGKAFTLRASQPNGVVVSEASSEHKSNYKIRKLTPTECCRLQGFPDNYVSMVSNTQGYKGLGNSFTVPVIKHIINNL